ncbi:hypothetical protein [Accumulibacter sp.]|uniref:hypothetical protein n=1 Tax=Accumulibacter sp. TaxID=2053492 RepID=UPI0025848A17|nr:hypothetical protein [Accumulibacter sp.]
MVKALVQTFIIIVVFVLIVNALSPSKSSDSSGSIPSGSTKYLPWESQDAIDYDIPEDPPECSVHPERCVDFNEPDIEPPVEYGGRATGVTSQCSPAYPDVCIPPAPPDLNCKDIPYKRFRVLQPDPHKFDGNKNGIGCE